ncbi:hypothetical protein EDB19DRAFT_1751609 [Suillus lakei]|nr:hypothetical protein EDB19DRAFT_1751609 [Suillus lakei]
MSPGEAQPDQPNLSSTPPCANLSSHISNLKSTPLSRGTSAASDHIGLIGAKVYEIHPWIERVIGKTKTCNVDVMLGDLLQRASNNPKTPQPDLLDKCLEAVLKVCNGKFSTKEREPGKIFHSSQVAQSLRDYSLSMIEPRSYASFIKATNTALACLEEIPVEGTRAASRDLEIICQRNDMPIYQTHQTEQSKRMPNVFILPSKSSKEAFPEVKNPPWDHRVQNAAEKPKGKRIFWKDVLASIEFKRTPNFQLKGPEVLYKVTHYEPTVPEYRKVPVREVSAGPATGVSVLQTQAEQSAPDLPPPRRSNRDDVVKNTTGSSKRKAEDDGESATKRAKTTDVLDVTVQTGLYAAEMFAANIAVTHLLNLIIVDTIVWIWYYDRQGIIQSSGIDFMKDLPRFMVLLYALQRFNLGDWGRNTEFDEVVEQGVHKTTLDGVVVKDGVHETELGGVDLVIHTDSEERVTHYGLQGRATNVFPVTSDKLCTEFPDSQKDGMVAKIFWAEEDRISEPEILKKVHEIAAKESDVKGHVPQLLWYCRFPNPTRTVREALGIPEARKGSRVLYILVFRKLDPITALYGIELFDVWHQCILCHIALWKGGVYHLDISPGNLMCYKKEGRWIGVLNDYDLSSLNINAGPTGNERTGTVPFMALDLLNPEGQRGEVAHLYRHDLESFVWVLVWVCLRYKNGVLLAAPSRLLDEWATLDPVTCGAMKSMFLDRFVYFERDWMDPQIWMLVEDSLEVLDNDKQRQKKNIIAQVRKARKVIRTDAEEQEEEKETGKYDLFRALTTTEAWKRCTTLRLPS